MLQDRVFVIETITRLPRIIAEMIFEFNHGTTKGWYYHYEFYAHRETDIKRDVGYFPTKKSAIAAGLIELTTDTVNDRTRFAYHCLSQGKRFYHEADYGSFYIELYVAEAKGLLAPCHKWCPKPNCDNMYDTIVECIASTDESVVLGNTVALYHQCLEKTKPCIYRPDDVDFVDLDFDEWCYERNYEDSSDISEETRSELKPRKAPMEEYNEESMNECNEESSEEKSKPKPVKESSESTDIDTILRMFKSSARISSEDCSGSGSPVHKKVRFNPVLDIINKESINTILDDIGSISELDEF